MASNSATVAPLFAARVAPILRTPCADFATPAALHASRNTLPNNSFVSGAAALSADESEVCAWASLQDFVKGGQNRNGDGHAGLFGPDRRHAIADMLAPKVHRIAATQPGIEQHGQPNAFFGADGPALFVSLHIVLGPHRKPGGLRTCRILYAGRGIGLDVASIKSPAKQTAHRVEEIPGLRRRTRPAVATGNDMLALDRGCLFMAGLFEHSHA